MEEVEEEVARGRMRRRRRPLFISLVFDELS